MNKGNPYQFSGRSRLHLMTGLRRRGKQNRKKPAGMERRGQQRRSPSPRPPLPGPPRSRTVSTASYPWTWSSQGLKGVKEINFI